MEVKTCYFLLLYSSPLFPSPHSHSFPFWGVFDCCGSATIVRIGIDVVIVGMLACTKMGWIPIVGGGERRNPKMNVDARQFPITLVVCIKGCQKVPKRRTKVDARPCFPRNVASFWSWPAHDISCDMKWPSTVDARSFRTTLVMFWDGFPLLLAISCMGQLVEM